MPKIHLTPNSSSINYYGEGGSGGGESVLVIEATLDDDTGKTVLNKTWQEIKDAVTNNTMCFVKCYADIFLVSRVDANFISSSQVEFYVNLADFRSPDTYLRFAAKCSGQNEYPSWED